VPSSFVRARFWIPRFIRRSSREVGSVGVAFALSAADKVRKGGQREATTRVKVKRWLLAGGYARGIAWLFHRFAFG
jgi:hypothetical protein